MSLSEKAIKEFQEIYKKESGIYSSASNKYYYEEVPGE